MQEEKIEIVSTSTKVSWESYLIYLQLKIFCILGTKCLRTPAISGK